jgi:hypothetical protein
MVLLPLWGKVGKGVINIYSIIVLCMIADTHIIKIVSEDPFSVNNEYQIYNELFSCDQGY